MSLAKAIPIPPKPHKSKQDDLQAIRQESTMDHGSTSRSLPVPIISRGVIPVEKEQIISQIDKQTWTEWKGFSKQLDKLTNWLSDTVKQLDDWKTPSDNVFSLRVQLEKHLAFALQIETHQQEKENVISSSKLFINFAPLQPYLNETLRYIEIQWKGLKKQLQKQHKQIEEALTVAEMCISNGSLDIFEGDSLTYEQTQDVLDQIGMRLRSLKSSFRLNEDTLIEDADNKGYNSVSGLMDSGYGSSPDFEVLYEELNEWLEEMQGVLTDNASVTQDRSEHISKSYDSQLQIHDITRRYLEDKATNTKTSHCTSNAGNKISDVNLKWKQLERQISCNKEQDVESGVEHEEQTVEKETSLSEIEDMIAKLKAWLTETEYKLFAPESRTCLGHVAHLERRLDLHKAIQKEINDHSESIDTVLGLCDALNEGNGFGATEKKKESLQLAAINLERRWDAIQSQSINLQCGLDEKLRVFKGVFDAKILKDPLSEDESLDTSSMKSFDVDSEINAASILITPSKFYGRTRQYRPTASQDDGAISRELNYDEVLMVREAFSENDAFSISDVSEILEDDFEFDDVLPLKRLAVSQELPSNDEEDLDIKDLAPCPSNPFPVMQIPDKSPAEEATSDVEFWSVSPTEDRMMDKVAKSDVQPKIIKANQTDYVSDFEVVDDYFIDASQDSFNNVFILPLFNPDDDYDVDDEEIFSMISDFEADMESAVQDVVDHQIAEIREVFPIEVESSTIAETRSSYKMPCFTYTEQISLNSNNNNNNDDDIEDSSSDDDNDVIINNGGNDEDDCFDLCSPNTGVKLDTSQDRSRSVCSGYESLESKSFWCSDETADVIDDDNATVLLETSNGRQDFKCSVYNPLSIKSRKVSDIRRRFSSSSTTKNDDLMEISDISLVHMVESVDHATLLANSICDFGRCNNVDKIQEPERENIEEASNQRVEDVAEEKDNVEVKKVEEKVEEEEEDDATSVCTTNTSELLEELEDVMDELAQLGKEPVEDLNLEPLITDVYLGPTVDSRTKDFGSTYSQTDSLDSGVFTSTDLSIHESTMLPCLTERINEPQTAEMINYDVDNDMYLENEETVCNEEDDENKEEDVEFEEQSYDDSKLNGSRHLVKRVVKYALPIQILLSVYMILLLVIPAIIETSGWECSISINNKAFFESLTLNPILKYIRGPPPV